MRILLIGFIVFIGWASVSTYIYVCKIKGLCANKQTILVTEPNSGETTPTQQLAPERVTIPQDLVIYFAFDRSDFTASNNANDFFDASKSYLNHNHTAELSITGHTDAVGTKQYNMSLGMRRAQIIQQFFIDKGIAANRIKIESEGEENPVANNRSKNGRTKNRRALITIKQ